MNSSAYNTITRGVLASLITSLISTGCQQPVQQHVTPLDLTAAANADALHAPSPESQTPTSTLAEQSQRDVEAILNARNRSNPVPDDFAFSAPAQSPPRKSVVWNDPPATRSDDSGATSHVDQHKTAIEQSSVTAPIATDPSKPRSLEADRLKSLMVDLSRELYASGAYSDSPLRELLMIAAMSLVDPTRQLEPNAIPDLTPKERELLANLQSFFAQLGKSLDGAADTEQAIVEAVAVLRETLVKQPVLGLPTAMLCTRVGGFGDFSAFEKNTFLAHSQQKVIVYLEIADFTSELNQKNEYVTRIAQQLVIYSDRDGIPVWREDWQTAVDVTKNRRQDFFTVQVITLPQALSVGKYQLKVRVRDEKTLAEAETTIPFELVADARLASK